MTIHVLTCFRNYTDTTISFTLSSCLHTLFLPDTEVLYTKVTQNILDECGIDKTYTWDVKSQVMGLQREDVAAFLCAYYELPMTVEEYMDKTQEQIENLMRNCSLMPGKCFYVHCFTNVVFFLFFSFFIFPRRIFSVTQKTHTQDTEKIYEKVFSDICKRYNKPFPLETRQKVLGRTEVQSCTITVNDCQLPITVAEFFTQYKELTLNRLRDVSTLGGNATCFLLHIVVRITL